MIILKKLISVVLLAAMMFTLVIPASANATQTQEVTYFEPSYDKADWSTETEGGTIGDNVSFSATNKSIRFGADSGFLKTSGMSGDFILTFKVNNEYAGGNYIKFKIAEQTIIFDGAGNVALNGTDNIIAVLGTGKPVNVVIEYKNVGEINYNFSCSTGTASYKLSGREYANKNNGEFSIAAQWTNGSFKNFKFYKPINGTYLNTFDADTTLSDLDVVSGKFITREHPWVKTLHVLSTGIDGCHFAWLKKFMTGSFSWSFDYGSSTSNQRDFIFNSPTDSEAYAFSIIENNKIGLYKGNISNEGFKSTQTLVEKNVSDISDILVLNNFGEITKVRIDYNSELGSINVYINSAPKAVLNIVGDAHKNKAGRLGMYLQWQNFSTFIDNLKIETSIPEFAVSAPVISVNGAKDAVVGTVTVDNTTKNEKSAVVILAVYDEYGKLKFVNSDSVSNEALIRDVKLQVWCGWQEGYTAKCFVFDTFNDITPLTNCVTYPAA